MTRSRMIRWLLFVFLFSFPALSSFAETIELVTYYPAPGQGNDLHVNSLTVGPNYANQNPGPGVVLIENQLGIGTTAPAGALHVVGLAGGLDQVLFMPGVGGTLNVGIGMLNSPSLLGLGVDTGDPATRQAITVGNAGLGAPSPEGTLSAGDKLVLWNDAPGFYKASIGLAANNELWLQSSGNNANNKITFYTSNAAALPSERMRISANGNVGIGTVAPASALHVHNAQDVGLVNISGTFNALTDAYSALRFNDATADANNLWTIAFRASPGGPPAPASQNALQFLRTSTTGVNTTPMVIQPSGFVGIGTANPLSLLHVAGANDAVSVVAFMPGLDTNGALVGVVPEIRVGIGTTNPVKTLDVIGDAAFQGNNLYIKNPFSSTGAKTWGFVVNTVGKTFAIGRATDAIPVGGSLNGHIHIVMDANNNTTQVDGITVGSDARLKTDVIPLSGMLEKVAALQGVRFRWKEPEPSARVHMGLLAQDVEKVFPEMVYATGPDGMKSIASLELIGVLTEAVKELKAENDSLKRRVEQLEKGKEPATSSDR